MDIIKCNLKFSSLSKRSLTQYFILHHSACEKCSVEDVHRWHKDKGWSGIGYQFLIRKDGTIYEGRPLNTIGAHTINFNNKSIGICCEGNFENEKMNDKQKYSLIELLQYLKKLYPEAIVKGHKEFSSTACPGKNFPLNEMKIANITDLKGDENMKYYEKLEEVPKIYVTTIKKFIDKGIIKGNGNGLHLSEDMCRMLVFVDRLHNN